MIKITSIALVAAATLIASNAFAGDACCAEGKSHTDKTACANLAALNLTPDQKAKIEAWEAECMKAGCTEESRQTFLKQAKAILSAEQFAQLEAACKKPTNGKKQA